MLTDHLADMQNFMPAEHRAVIDRSATPAAATARWPKKSHTTIVLEAMATFREMHFGYAHEYINKRVADPRGTGGTPYMQWLAQLIEETRAHKIS